MNTINCQFSSAISELSQTPIFSHSRSRPLVLVFIFSLFFYFINVFDIFLPGDYAYAEESRYEIVPNDRFLPQDIKFSLGYTLGTHVGKLERGGSGYVVFNPENIETLKGEFSIPIDGIRTGDLTRDCHLRESLGLNYELSGYPAEHLCSNQNTLPLNGHQSIQYPFIHFTLTHAAFTTAMGAQNFARTHQAEVQIYGRWGIHGQTKNFVTRMQLQLTPDGQGLFANGSFPLLFDDFGIKVKPARVLGLSITVKTKVHVDLKLKLKLKQAVVL